MDREQVLQVMRGYFQESQPPEVLASLATQSPRALLRESMDVAEFVFYLEEELGQDLDVATLGEAIANRSFGELAEELARRID